MGVSFITIGANWREDKDNSWALDDPMARGWKCQTKHNYFVKLPEGFGQRPFNKRWSDGALSEEASKQFWQGYRMIRYAYQRWSGHFFLLAMRESALWGYWAICTPLYSSIWSEWSVQESIGVRYTWRTHPYHQKYCNDHKKAITTSLDSDWC